MPAVRGMLSILQKSGLCSPGLQHAGGGGWFGGLYPCGSDLLLELTLKSHTPGPGPADGYIPFLQEVLLDVLPVSGKM